METCPKAFEKMLLDVLNGIRNQHGSPPLEYSYEISNYSQQWSKELSTSQPFNAQHQLNNTYGGEILYTNLINSKEIIICHELILNRLGNLPNNYQYYGDDPPENHANKNKYDDFTRIIWYSSQQVGFGCSMKESSTISGYYRSIVVINFNPPGNQYCLYRKNVLPLKDSNLYKELTSNGVENIQPSVNCSCECTEEPNTSTGNDNKTSIEYTIASVPNLISITKTITPASRTTILSTTTATISTTTTTTTTSTTTTTPVPPTTTSTEYYGYYFAPLPHQGYYASRPLYHDYYY